MNPFENTFIEVEIRFPRGKTFRAGVEIAPGLAEESLRPLSRYREIIPNAAVEAMEKKRLREMIVETVGRQLADKLLKIIESQDPVNGYENPELRRND